MRTQITNNILKSPPWAKRTLIVAVDLFLCCSTFYFALLLAAMDIENSPPLNFNSHYLPGLLLSSAMCVTIGLFFGTYSGVFRRSDSTNLLVLFQAGLVYAFCFGTLVSFVEFYEIPRSVGLVQPLFLYVCIFLTRVVARILLTPPQNTKVKLVNRKKIIIYGAGKTGLELANSLSNSNKIDAVAFVDDDKSLHDRFLLGLKISDPENLKNLIDKLDATEIVLALPSVMGRRKAEILSKLQEMRVPVRTLPTQEEMLSHQYSRHDFRALRPEEILGRDAHVARQDLLKSDIEDCVVLVTGAGGSIGSELCRQIIRQRPPVLVLFEQSEFSLFSIHKELLQLCNSDKSQSKCSIYPILGSVEDEEKVRQVIARFKPHTIYHAAAYKHVSLVETNCWAALKNNVFGTQTLGKVACEFLVSKFVLVSTDKAVRPTSVMGVTKRLAELIIQSLAAKSEKTIFAMVRFGNVLNSSGSVLPIFQTQIEKGGPLTVTHPEVTRYFMTIEEAAQLVIQAGALTTLSDNAEDRALVFLLDMGEPIKILDLARQMVELSGKSVFDKKINPEGDLVIDFVGLKPGEKLYEELLIDSEAIRTEHKNVFVADDTGWPMDKTLEYLGKLHLMASDLDDQQLRSFLALEFPSIKG